MRWADDLRCQAILFQGSKSFAAASLLLPHRVRWPATAVYAFCRVADDVVDLSSDPDAVDRLHERLDRVYADRPQDHPADRAFARVVQSHSIPIEVPRALLQGFEWDRASRRYETLSDVRAYSVRVASTVGVMMTLLMGRRDSETLARACDLGVAMQLTNIARDVGEDARAGRIYLPLAWLREADIDPDRFVQAPVYTPELGNLVARLLAEAERLYKRAETGIGLLPWDCRPAIGAARLIYAEICTEIMRNGFDSVSRRAYTSRLRKLELLARALAWPLTGPPPVNAPVLAEAKELIASVK